MKIKPFILACSLIVCSLFTGIMQAQAATATYVVAPFTINGPSEYNYLAQAIPQMLTSRLFWGGQYETSTQQENIVKKSNPTTKAEAEQLLGESKANYLFYGSIAIIGQEADINIYALDTKGGFWQKTAQSSINSLISTMQSLADTLSKEVFNRTISQSTKAPVMSNTGTVPLAGDFIVNETGTNQVYLNPEFRYQGQDADRLRSQSLPFAAISMDITDLNDDTKNEIIFLDDDRYCYLYSWDQGSLQQLASYKLPAGLRPLVARGFRQQGKNYIAISTYREDNRNPIGIILEYDGKNLVEINKNITYFLNTAYLPDSTRPVLIGQDGDRSRLFRGSVFELYVQGDTVVKGPHLPNLPDKANVFNFVYLPDKEDSMGYKVVLLNENEKLLVYSSSGSRIHQSDETYSGGNGYFKYPEDGENKFYYIPMRMEIQDLDNNGKSEVLANKPISTAGALFKNFRNYPQGEVHSLVWDGIGLNLLWKTRRISGTVADFQLADPNNNGVKDLAVCVVTYPGALGIGERKTVLTLFPLDTNLTDPSTPIYNE